MDIDQQNKLGVLANVQGETAKPLEPQQVWDYFLAHGIAVTEWARANGFKPSNVYLVLSGRSKCSRGKSHEIAKALGLK